MYLDPLSTTTPAGIGINNIDWVKGRETQPSQEEFVGINIPMEPTVYESICGM